MQKKKFLWIPTWKVYSLNMWFTLAQIEKEKKNPEISM